jgi:hypothetical protein
MVVCGSKWQEKTIKIWTLPSLNLMRAQLGVDVKKRGHEVS